VYTNPSNIAKTLVQLLERNALIINRVIQGYEPSRKLCVFEGMRKTLAASFFPSLEIEPTSGSNQWATTRAQRPRYSFNCVLTVLNDNEDYGVEYIATIMTVLAEILTDPTNLQMLVLNETVWDHRGGLLDTRILDSLVEDITYNASKDGTIRTVEFSWFALIHEPFPESKWDVIDPEFPTVIRPRIV